MDRPGIAALVAEVGGTFLFVFVGAQDTRHLGTPVLGGVTWSGGIAVEAVLTVVLVAAVFASASGDRPAPWAGLTIGLAVAADILGGGPLTGASMNPARWLGPA